MPAKRGAAGSTRKPGRPRKGAETSERKGSLGFEADLWRTADLLRSNMDPAEYKHVVLGLLFLKYISDAFDDRAQQLATAVSDSKSEYFVSDAKKREKELAHLREDPDEFTGAHVFWVPQEARWENLRANARQPKIGKLIDDAMDAVEKANPTLKGSLPKVYALPNLDKDNLGKLIDTISNIGLGSAEHREKDTLGRVYEYFLSRFASAEGKGGGEYYTPANVVRVLVEMLEPYEGRVYDPCCGSGGMFVQSIKFIEAHGGRKDKISVFGQESNHTTWKLARMNLAIRGIEVNLGPKHADTFREDLHPDLKADFILANPPFNVSEWHGDRLKDDVRWKYGVPPEGNANFAWVQHFIHHLGPGGTAGFVLANGSMSSGQSGEGEIRKAIVEADLVDCMVALPGQLFYSTQIPVCLWFLTRSKKGGKLRDRRGETLFIDARKLGALVDRTHRELAIEDIAKVADAYHAWRGEKSAGEYADVAGFCMAAKVDDIRKHGHVLTPGRYVGAEEIEEDGEPFDAKMKRLTTTLRAQQAEAARLDKEIAANLKRLGHGE